MFWYGTVSGPPLPVPYGTFHVVTSHYLLEVYRTVILIFGQIQIFVFSQWPVNPDWFYASQFAFLVPAHPGSPGQITEEQ